MAIDPVSSVAPVRNVQPLAVAASPEPRVYMQGRGSAEPAPDAVVPVVLDVEASLRESVAQITRSIQAQGPLPLDVSAAAASYEAEFQAETQQALAAAVPPQNNRAQLDILA